MKLDHQLPEPAGHEPCPPNLAEHLPLVPAPTEAVLRDHQASSRNAARTRVRLPSDSDLATGSLNPPRPNTHRPLAKAATTKSGAAAPKTVDLHHATEAHHQEPSRSTCTPSRHSRTSVGPNPCKTPPLTASKLKTRAPSQGSLLTGPELAEVGPDSRAPPHPTTSTCRSSHMRKRGAPPCQDLQEENHHATRRRLAGAGDATTSRGRGRTKPPYRGSTSQGEEAPRRCHRPVELSPPASSGYGEGGGGCGCG